MSNDMQSKGIDALYGRVTDILSRARRQTVHAVNSAMVSAYWVIGREIVDEEQRGSRRADYGTKLITAVSARLTQEFGPGFSTRHLRRMRQFYLVYAHRVPTRPPPTRNALKSGDKIWPTVSAKSSGRFSVSLSWSHYCELLKVPDEAAPTYPSRCCDRISSTGSRHAR